MRECIEWFASRTDGVMCGRLTADTDCQVMRLNQLLQSIPPPFFSSLKKKEEQNTQLATISSLTILSD